MLSGPKKEDIGGGKALVYKSSSMVERRLRILREARRMIAETDSIDFSLEELCARAGVAKNTIYNAFGSKENVIASAIQQYIEDFSASVTSVNDRNTVEGRLERLIKSSVGLPQIRAYTTAIMAIYNSPKADPQIRAAIRDVPVRLHTPFVERLAELGRLAPGVAPEQMVAAMITSNYAVYSDWTHGEIPDDGLVDRICEAWLVVMAGFTTDGLRKETLEWLDLVRTHDPRWTALLKLAETPRQRSSRKPAAAAKAR